LGIYGEKGCIKKRKKETDRKYDDVLIVGCIQSGFCIHGVAVI
jgi:hypothetical protein